VAFLLSRLPSTFDATRDALHAVAEHVLAPARWRVDGHIGLQPTPGGFGTPEIAGVQVRVDGVDLVRRLDAAERRIELTTVGAAAEFCDVRPGVPGDLYPPATRPDVDAALEVDPAAATALAAWYAFAQARIDELRAWFPPGASSPAQLWPEHFDLATEAGDESHGTRANYGASPGDETIDEPYLYVGPWDASRRREELAAFPFGAALRYSDLLAAAEPEDVAAEFFAACAQLLARSAG
jgi:hypothetical protein